MNLVSREIVEGTNAGFIQSSQITGFNFDDILKDIVGHCDLPEDVKELLTTALFDIRERNRTAFKASREKFPNSPVGVFFNGNKSTPDEGGFVGDIIESARVTDWMSKKGLPVRVVSSSPDFIQVAPLRGIEVIPDALVIDESWHTVNRYRDKVCHVLGDDVRLISIPTIAYTPQWIGPDASGQISPDKRFNRYLSRYSDVLCFKKKQFWLASGSLNQSHALMCCQNLLGWLEEPIEITRPPLRYKTVEEVDDYIASNFGQQDKILLFHIGTDGEKSKLWPKDRWKQLTAEIGIRHPECKIRYFVPRNKGQQEETMQIVSELASKHKEIDIGLLPVLCAAQFCYFQQRVLEYFKSPPILNGVDSAPAGHIYPALGGSSLVIGNSQKEAGGNFRGDYYFSCPFPLDDQHCVLVLPPDNQGNADLIPVDYVLLGLDELIKRLYSREIWA